MTAKSFIPLLAVLAATAALAAHAAGLEKTERFDRDPGWEGVNNRPAGPGRKIKQDFGYSRTRHAGGEVGEMGGLITPCGEPAYYARRIPQRTFEDTLTASGTLLIPDSASHMLLGFFNNGTLNEWRTPNTVAVRLSGRGPVFYAWLEYCTSRWRAGGDSPQGFTVRDAAGKAQQMEFKSGVPYRWTLKYDPAANNGAGVVTATLGDQTAVCNLDAGHKADGAAFNRFGLLTILKSADTGGPIWLDDLTINGETERFDRDPGWEAVGNRREYETREVRPRFDFGFTPTRHAGGQRSGELGGIMYRGDGRYADKTAWYGDRVGPLSLENPLRASGKLALRRGVSDSTTLLGFFNSKTSTRIHPGQNSGWPDDFFGVAVEGPSSEGFFLYPAYSVQGKDGHGSRAPKPNYVLPDGKAHDWALEYSPTAGMHGQVKVTMDGNTVVLDLNPGDRSTAARFDRFGFVTTRIDGNGQHIFFDDLTYTVRQE